MNRNQYLKSKVQIFSYLKIYKKIGDNYRHIKVLLELLEDLQLIMHSNLKIRYQ